MCCHMLPCGKVVNLVLMCLKRSHIPSANQILQNIRSESILEVELEIFSLLEFQFTSNSLTGI